MWSLDKREFSLVGVCAPTHGSCHIWRWFENLEDAFMATSALVSRDVIERYIAMVIAICFQLRVPKTLHYCSWKTQNISQSRRQNQQHNHRFWQRVV